MQPLKHILLVGVFFGGLLSQSSLEAGACKNFLKALVSPLKSPYFWVPPAWVLVDGVEVFTKKRPLEKKNLRNAALGILASSFFAVVGNEFQKSNLTTEKNLFSAAISVYLATQEMAGFKNAGSPRVLEIVGIDPPFTLRKADPFRNQFLDSLGVKSDQVSLAEYAYENPGQAKLTRWDSRIENFSIFILRGHHAGNSDGIIALIPKANMTTAAEFSKIFMPHAAPDIFIVAATCEGLAGNRDEAAWQSIAKEHLARFPSGSLTILAATQDLHRNPFADFSSIRGLAFNGVSPAIMPIRLGMASVVTRGPGVPFDQRLTPNLPGNLRTITFKNK